MSELENQTDNEKETKKRAEALLEYATGSKIGNGTTQPVVHEKDVKAENSESQEDIEDKRAAFFGFPRMKQKVEKKDEGQPTG